MAATVTKLSVGTGQLQVPNRMSLLVDITASASDGSIADIAVDPADYSGVGMLGGLTGWYFYSVTFIPGTTAPTTAMDVVANDARSTEDKLWGLLADIDTSKTTSFFVATTGKSYPTFDSEWTFKFSGNSVHSAGMKLILTFTRD